MRTNNPYRIWRCKQCAEMVKLKDMLRAPNPFIPEDELLGCPSCNSIDQWEPVCDEPGCVQLAGFGWPTSDGGYRTTCGKHAKF